VARSLGRFELFGVNRGREPSKQSFEDSYVNLIVRPDSEPGQRPANEAEKLTGAGVAVANALSGRKRVILRGSAGSGKTTLLNWLAANGAAGRLTGESGPWGEVVPFLVRLRDFTKDRPLPKIEELPGVTAPAIEGERPAGWATATFAAGRALLLVDGVDELAAERLHLLAAAGLEQADVLPDNEIRADVQRAAARLIPPSSFEEAALLARSGEFVLDLPATRPAGPRRAADGIRGTHDHHHRRRSLDRPNPGVLSRRQDNGRRRAAQSMVRIRHPRGLRAHRAGTGRVRRPRSEGPRLAQGAATAPPDRPAPPERTRRPVPPSPPEP
jgi:hypothetical protein